MGGNRGRTPHIYVSLRLSILLSFLVCESFGASSGEGDQFKYPLYCAKLSDFDQVRRPPPLTPEAQSADPILVQVQVLTRHGSRTPAQLERCWANYQPHWDCNSGKAFQSAGSTGSSVKLVERFDVAPAINALGGTCMLGQLVDEGAEQHRRLGQLLGEAYLGAAPDPKHRIPTPNSPPLFSVEDLREGRGFEVRSTKVERTQLSAAHLLSGMLGSVGINAEDVTLPLHTHDAALDDLPANRQRCPPLGPLKDEALASSEYQAMKASQQPLRAKLAQLTNLTADDIKMSVLWDCWASHVCADKWDTLPKGLNPATTNVTGIAHELMTAALDEDFFPFQYKGADFAKLAVGGLVRQMRRLAAEVLLMEPVHVNEFVDVDRLSRLLVASHDSSRPSSSSFSSVSSSKRRHSSSDDAPSASSSYADNSDPHSLPKTAAPASSQWRVEPAPRMSIVSAHDITIWSLLAALQLHCTEWPPYAAVMLLEIYHLRKIGRLTFRLVYNGQDLTAKLPACSIANPAMLEEGVMGGIEIPKGMCPLWRFFESTDWVGSSSYNCNLTTTNLYSTIEAIEPPSLIPTYWWRPSYALWLGFEILVVVALVNLLCNCIRCCFGRPDKSSKDSFVTSGNRGVLDDAYYETIR